MPNPPSYAMLAKQVEQLEGERDYWRESSHEWRANAEDLDRSNKKNKARVGKLLDSKRDMQLRLHDLEKVEQNLRAEVDKALTDNGILRRAIQDTKRVIYLSPMGLHAILASSEPGSAFYIHSVVPESGQNTWPYCVVKRDLNEAVKVCKQLDDEWLDNPVSAEGD